MRSPSFLATVTALALLTACSSDDAAETAPPPPAPESLFGTLPAATPDKLRGVWQNTQTQTNGTIELRIRFTEKYVVGAAKCTAKDGPEVLAGGSTGLATGELDAATGKVTFATLGLQKQENGLLCQVSLPGDTYDFTIADGSLSLTKGNAKLSTTFTKIGD